MTATPSTVAEYVTLARQAIAAGDAAAAAKYTDQAKALKALTALEDTQPRLDFGGGTGAPEAAPQALALKSWYAKQFGADLDADAATMMADLYGKDYRALAYAKNVGFVRYLRSGRADELAGQIVMTPAQVMERIANGDTFTGIKATLVESQSEYGGYLVPEDFHDTVIQRIQGLTAMRGIATTMTTDRDRITMPVITGGDDRYIGSVRVVKTDESPTSTQAATDQTFGALTIPVFVIMAHTAVSKNLLEDSRGATSIVPILNEQFSTAYAVFEDEQFLVGNGVGGPSGILKDNTTGGPNTFAYGSLATVNSGAATAITADSIRAMPYSIPTQYRSAGGVWLMSRGTLRVIKSLKDGQGNYLWSSRGDTPQLAQGAPASLEGYPIKETEVLPSPTSNSGSAYTAGYYPILFVTRPVYTIVDKPIGGMAVERYEDSTTAKTNTVVMVLRRRVGGNVTAPWGGAAMKISA